MPVRVEEFEMAERSFKKEVQQLRIGAGEEFRGEGILAVTKALLQSGVEMCIRDRCCRWATSRTSCASS